ncbi:MAG: AAA family ATPase [Xanthomonadales bacterium]|nr:AAA family ATPase [Xanthomonadales bacterium]
MSNFLSATGRKCVLAAPTGKAARVLTQKSGRVATTIHKKIYSTNDVKEYKVEGLDGSETYKFYAELRVNEDADNTVYIVDESSMVSDVYSEGEFFRFGTGRLLSDLFKYINLDHNDHDKKLIFIGDPAQLPPIGMPFSPALNPSYLSKTFGVHQPPSYELTQVVRQESGSGILRSASDVRGSTTRFSAGLHPEESSDVHPCATTRSCFKITGSE